LDQKKIKKAIKYISHKNICAIPEWKAKYPDCIYSDSKKSNQYNHIVVEAMGGPGDNDAEKADKIVKKIAKEDATTEWMSEQLRDELKKYKYDAVVILGGSNDVYDLGKIDRAKKNLDEMYNFAHTLGSKVIAITPPEDLSKSKNKTEEKLLLSDLVDWIMKNKIADYKIDFHSISNTNKNEVHELVAEKIKDQLA
jgi:hypothetical protein